MNRKTTIHPEQVARWPGKSNPAGQPHPALWHMLDVGAVAARLIARRSLTGVPALDQACCALVALHDIGKVSASFAAMLDGALPKSRHWRLSYYFLSFPLQRMLDDRLGLDQAARSQLVAAVSGHHSGPPGALGRRDICKLEAEIGAEAAGDAAIFAEQILDLFPLAQMEGLSDEAINTLSFALAGFTTQCDWIGSNTDWFEPQPATIAPPEYWQAALEKAEWAISAAHLGAARPDPAAAGRILPAESLRPMQRAVAQAALPDGPMMALIEDATGAGKTEAAVILAARMMAAGKAQGLFFALPTMATSNAMFDRLRPIASRLFSGSPSLALTHGRASGHQGFQSIIGRESAGRDDPTCGAWLADDRRLVLLAEIGIGTIDQALMAVLPTKFSTLRLHALSQRVLVVDEAHSYDPYMKAQLERLVWFQAMLGGSVIIMTATLPLDLRDALIAAFRKGLGIGTHPLEDQAYPALTLVGLGVQNAAIAPVPASIRRVEVERLASADAAAEVIAQAAGLDAACIWVRNSVDDAIAAVELLRSKGVVADLLHARFALCDRLSHEQEAFNRFGAKGQGRAGKVLVATQVAEQSLDLDFDVMVSDLAPIGALIQRAGRLWRHMETRPAARRPVAGPVLHILSPDPDKVTNRRWLHEVLGSGAFVYPADVQWRTARAVFDAGAIVAPEGLRDLIEAVHRDTELPEPLQQAEIETEGKALSERQSALNLLADPGDGYMQQNLQRVFDDEAVRTRLGRLQVTLVLAREHEGRLVAWAEGAGDWAASEVQLGEYRYSKLEGVDQSAPLIAAVKAGWPEWKRDRLILAPVAADGTICDGLHYDPSLGLLLRES